MLLWFDEYKLSFDRIGELLGLDDIYDTGYINHEEHRNNKPDPVSAKSPNGFPFVSDTNLISSVVCSDNILPYQY